MPGACAADAPKGDSDKPPPGKRPVAGYSAVTPPPGARGQPPMAAGSSGVNPPTLQALPLPPAPPRPAKFDPGCTADQPHRCGDGRCREKCL